MQVFRSIKWDTPNNTRSDKHLTNITVSDRLCFGDHAIGFVKRFRIVSEKYGNRRRRFGLRFNFVAGICNYELSC